MLPTPDTAHVPYHCVYEPAEDSFLLIDTLALPAETAFLQARFAAAAAAPPPPLVVEVGSGSGVVLAFVVAQAAHLFGAAAAEATGPLALAVDVNAWACAATTETVRRAVGAAAQGGGGGDGEETGPLPPPPHGQGFLGAVCADLVAALRPGQVDVLLFNPPYVPTPSLPAAAADDNDASSSFARDARLLELAYAGGRDGMETTDRLLAALPAVLSARGCAYVLLCAQNRPEAVKERIRGWAAAAATTGTTGAGGEEEEEGGRRRWHAETVGTSGRQAGWEKLQIVRIWQE